MNVKQAQEKGIAQVYVHERGLGSWTIISLFVFIAALAIAFFFGPAWGAFAVLCAIYLRLRQ